MESVDNAKRLENDLAQAQAAIRELTAQVDKLRDEVRHISSSQTSQFQTLTVKEAKCKCESCGKCGR